VPQERLLLDAARHLADAKSLFEDGFGMCNALLQQRSENKWFCDTIEIEITKQRRCVCVCVCLRVCLCVFTNELVGTTHTYTHIHTHTHIHTYIHACMHACIHTNKHT